MSSDPDTASLIGRAVDGDATALKLLLLELHDAVCRSIARRLPPGLGRTIDPEDVAQEAYVQVFRHVRSFQPRGEDSFRRWVTTIALRRLRNAIQRQRARKRGGGAPAAAVAARSFEDSCVALLDLLAAPGRTPSRTLAAREAAQVVNEALAGLPDDYRQAIRLVHLEGWPVAHVAAEMGRTERAIHGLCRRGLERLREQIGSRWRYLSSSG